MSETTTRIEAVREALPGEACQDGALLAEDDFLPCEQPATVVLRIIEDGVEQVVEFCDEHAHPLLQHAAEQLGGDAILP